MATPREALAWLRERSDEELAALVGPHGVRLLVAFGSTVDASEDAPEPRDLDLAVLPSRSTDPVALVTALIQATGCDLVDLMDLERAGIVARAAALERCVPLYEDEAGLFARQQMAALAMRAETGWICELQLDVLSG